MKKSIYFSIIALFIIVNASAQDNINTSNNISGAVNSSKQTGSDTTIKEGWTTGGVINISLTQAAQNNSWTEIKGGGNTQFFGVKGIVSYNFNRKKGTTNWLNSFTGRYGGSSSTVYVPATATTPATTSSVPFAKSDDYLNFTSIYGKEMSKTISYAGLFSVESQFERFLTPGYIKLGPGFLYEPNKYFNAFVSPAMANLTTKLTANSLPITEYGVDSGKTTVFDFGAFARVSFNYPIAKGITYTTTADLYSNYLSQPGNMVFDWNNLFTLTVNKFVAATLSFNMRYNQLEVAKMQTQQGLGIGFNYKLK
jgi:hypothetical protein